MNSAVSNQSDLSTTYKPEATMAKSVDREEYKWEKGEVGQHLKISTNLHWGDECPQKS